MLGDELAIAPGRADDPATGDSRERFVLVRDVGNGIALDAIEPALPVAHRLADVVEPVDDLHQGYLIGLV